MKKYDELLKRVEIFEKLAVYGNRKEFLHSLSQLAPSLLDPKPGTEELGARELDELAKSQGRPVPMSYDPNASLIPKYKVPNTMGPPSSHANPKLDPEQKYWDDKAKGVSAPVTSAKPTASLARPVIKSDPTVQRAQKQLQNHEGIGVGSAGADGKLGPDTLEALKKYKAKIGVPSLSNAEAIKALSDAYKEPSAATKPGVFDPSLGF